ncbi:MAG: hypothetical protein AABW41_05705 [Nanoarchaeota archaeon]
MTSALDSYRQSRPNPAGGIETSIPRTAGYIISLVLRIFVFLLFLVLLVGIITFTINCNKLGTCKVLFEQGAFNIKSGIQKIDAESNIFSRIWSIIATGGASEVGNVDFGITKTETKKIIELDDIRTQPFYYFNYYDQNGQKIVNSIDDIKTSIKVDGIGQETKVMLNCALKDYNGKVTYEHIDNPEPSEDSQFTVPENTNRGSFGVGCNFVDGIEAPNAVQILDTVTGTVTAIFESSAESKWRPYILHSTAYKKLLSENKDVASLISKDPSYSFSNGVQGMKTEPSYESSEMIEIKSPDSMPFQNGKTYSLYIDLNTQDSFSGNLHSLKSLILTVPDSVELKTSETSCDYEPLKNDEEGNKVYALKKDVIERTNYICSKDSISKLAASYKQCASDYLTDIHTYCRMGVEINEIKSTPTFLQFTADAEYSYELRRTFSIILKKQA